MPLYLTSLGTPNSSYYLDNGVTPVYILPDNGYNCFRETYDWRPHFERVAEGPYYVALWADNVANRTTLFPPEDEEGWNKLDRNLRALESVCIDYSCKGVLFDSEIYTSTPNNNGGLMKKGKAWVQTAERGIQIRECFLGLEFGTYVHVRNANTLPGWREFFGAAFNQGSNLLLDEGGYLPRVKKDKRVFGNHAEFFPGRAIRDGKFRGKVPREPFWIYPWDGADNTDLAQFSRLWR